MSGFWVAQDGRTTLQAAEAPPQPTRADALRWFVADHPAMTGTSAAILLSAIAALGVSAVGRRKRR